MSDSALVGDVNCYSDDEQTAGELSIMIAEGRSQGKGFGQESVLLMMFFMAVWCRRRNWGRADSM